MRRDGDSGHRSEAALRRVRSTSHRRFYTALSFPAAIPALRLILGPSLRHAFHVLLPGPDGKESQVRQPRRFVFTYEYRIPDVGYKACNILCEDADIKSFLTNSTTHGYQH